MPHARRRTRTSPGPGSGASTCASAIFARPWIRAALIVGGMRASLAPRSPPAFGWLRPRSARLAAASLSPCVRSPRARRAARRWSRPTSTSAKRPPSLSGTNLPHDTPSRVAAAREPAPVVRLGADAHARTCSGAAARSIVPRRFAEISRYGPTCCAQLRGTPPPIVKMPSVSCGADAIGEVARGRGRDRRAGRLLASTARAAVVDRDVEAELGVGEGRHVDRARASRQALFRIARPSACRREVAAEAPR